jgi:hypothetical protein
MEEQEPAETLEMMQEQSRELTNLVKLPGWDLYLKVLDEQISGRTRDIIFTPCDSSVKQYEQEYRKGECQGLFTAMNLIPQMIEDLEGNIKLMLKKLPLEENENGTES